MPADVYAGAAAAVIIPHEGSGDVQFAVSGLVRRVIIPHEGSGDGIA